MQAVSTPNNLPVQLTSFIGREHDVAEVASVLTSTRLLTLTGPGGVGKTRLALAASAAVLDAFPQGVWVVELAAVSDPQLVVAHVASALGVRDSDGTVAHLAQVLAGRRALVLLDNCEHLRATCAGIAHELLVGCPEVAVLATSREPLAVVGERTWSVSPLTRVDAERLLCERVRLRQPDFRVTERDAATVAEICSRLDGIPLALELAAGLAGALSLSEIAARLDDRFALLGADLTGMPDRQRTLRATFDWSYDLLSEPERELFGRLSIFPGSFSVRGVEHVCGGDGLDRDAIVGLLVQLVDRSMVTNEQRGELTRYRLLETARHYAWERLHDRASTTTDAAVFRRDADYWTIAYGGTEHRLRHSVGLGHLHRLLARPGQEMHVLELIGSPQVGGSTEDVLLDPQARAAYRRQLEDLNAERDEARAFNDLERAARAEEEIDALVQQLAGAVGLGGRDRTTSSAAERARMSVRQAVASAIKRIAAENPTLARHLERSLRTGIYCSYSPETPVAWSLTS